jgi:NADPH:quinone reductase-like Zn-dependent oxidoreductase
MEDKNTMRAIVCTKYGPPEVLKLTKVTKPIPKDNEVLIKIFATTVHRGDVRMRGFDVPLVGWIPARLILGIRKPKPKVLGMELAGKIEAVGSAVTKFKPGNNVFAATDWSYSSYAEYVCLPEDAKLTLKPDNMTMEEAAAGAITGGMVALYVLKKAHIQPGNKVLIYGASGSVGTYAVQIAKHVYGAEVTGVCSTANLEMVKSLGADKVVDYTQEDFTQSGENFDVIFDAVAKLKKSHGKKALKKTGIYFNVDKDSGGGKELVEEIKELIEAGKIKAVIDRRYPMDQIVEAHRYVETGHKKGHVIINIVPE